MLTKIFQITVILFVTLCFTKANAQKGLDYVVNNQGDTLKGYILSTSLRENSLRFKSNQGEKNKFRPNEIKYFSIYNRGFYQSFLTDSLHQKPFFAELLVSGKANLYRVDYGKNEKRMIQKSDGKVFYISTKKDYITQFESIFSDCQGINFNAEELNKSNAILKDVRADVLKYNQCNKPDSVKWQSKAAKIYITKGVFVGLNQSNAEIILEPNYTGKYPSSGYEIGAFVNFSFARRLSFQIEGIYSPRFGNVKEDLLSNLYERKVTYYFQTLRVPLIVRYTALSGKVRPVLMAGLNNSVLLSQSGTYQLSQLPTTDKTFALNKLSTGFLIGIGLKIPITNQSSIITELRYYDSRLLQGVNTVVRNPILAFVIGVAF